MEDTAPDAQSFLKSLTNSPYFDVTVVKDSEKLIGPIIAGTIRGFVVIPSYFSNSENSKATPPILQIVADGSEPNTAQFVQNYVQGAWHKLAEAREDLKRFERVPLVQLESRFWYNEELESRNFLIPGSIAIIMTLIGTLLTALVMAREWERGTMESLMATPVTIFELVISKLIPYFFMGLGAMTLCVIVAVFLYDVPFRGSFMVLGIVSSAFLNHRNTTRIINFHYWEKSTRRFTNFNRYRLPSRLYIIRIYFRDFVDASYHSSGYLFHSRPLFCPSR